MDLMKHRRRSQLWTYFSVIDCNLAVCDLCKQKLSHKSSSSNLRKHLLRKHADVDPAILLPNGPPRPRKTQCISPEKVQETSPHDLDKTPINSGSFSVPPKKNNTAGKKVQEKVGDQVDVVASQAEDLGLNPDGDRDFSEADSHPTSPESSSPTEVTPVKPTNINLQSSSKINNNRHARTSGIINLVNENSERSKRKDLNEYEAVGVCVAAKLRRMDSVQAIYAESLISQILCRGLLKTLTSANLCEFIE